MLTALAYFSGTNGADPFITGLTWGTDGNLYGGTLMGGANNFGVVFEVTTNGVLTVIHDCAGGDSGVNPTGHLLLAADGYLYGTCEGGGTNGTGIIYRLTALYPAPQITVQPASLIYPAGCPSVYFYAKAVGGEPMSYQWLFDGAEIPGATYSTLAVSNIQPAQEGVYVLRVTNLSGSTFSQPATLLEATNPSASPLSWTATSSTHNYWMGIAGSADGEKLVAASDGSWPGSGNVWISTNAGVIWQVSSAPHTYWQFVTCSSNAQTIVAVATADYSTPTVSSLYLSTDGGHSWSEVGLSENWRSAAMSADGTKIVAVSYNPSRVYISTDSGQHWALSTSFTDTYLWSVASSADGNVLFAATDDGNIYRSVDGGVSWSAMGLQFLFEEWASIACSADGYVVAAASRREMFIDRLTVATHGVKRQCLTRSGACWPVLLLAAAGLQPVLPSSPHRWTLASLGRPRPGPPIGVRRPFLPLGTVWLLSPTETVMGSLLRSTCRLDWESARMLETPLPSPSNRLRPPTL
jgi:uncharacterized repeat protein (TIGR03803 family)